MKVPVVRLTLMGAVEPSAMIPAKESVVAGLRVRVAAVVGEPFWMVPVPWMWEE